MLDSLRLLAYNVNMLRSIANLLRLWADRLEPPEPEPEVLTMAEFCQRLKDERDEQIWRELQQVEQAAHASWLRRVK